MQLYVNPPEDRKAPCNSAIKALLKKGIHEEGWGWVRRGDGVKNSPHLYWKQR